MLSILALTNAIQDGEEGAMGAGGKGDAFTGDDVSFDYSSPTTYRKR